MQIHMIGHACIFVETQDCKILMDPVFWDPHCEEIEGIFPNRELNYEKLPEFDILIISHQHLDHFDIRSLASLPKNVDVLIPCDKVLQNCLSELGYSNIYPLQDFDEVKIGSTTLLTTRSEERVPEYGIVVADASGVFWNQVDTDVSLDTIRKVISRYSQVDFLLTRWQPLFEVNYQLNKSLSFPYDEYSQWLKAISFVQAKAISPGANGFKYVNGSSWLNQVAFPVTREQFCRDIKMVCPEVGENIFTLDPGDIISFDKGEFCYKQEKSQIVTRLDNNREILDFSPVNIGKNLKDYNSEQYDIDDMMKTIKEEICLNLPIFINENKNSSFLEHIYWNVVYQLEIVFPNSSCKWYFDFTENNIQAHSGRNPFANFLTTITASSFYSILKGIKGWDCPVMGGYYRSFKKIYVPTKYGIIKPTNEQIEEPLFFRFPYKDAFYKARQAELEKWNKMTRNDLVQHESKYFMMKMGNTLVRLSKTTNKEVKDVEYAIRL